MLRKGRQFGCFRANGISISRLQDFLRILANVGEKNGEDVGKGTINDNSDSAAGMFNPVFFLTWRVRAMAFGGAGGYDAATWANNAKVFLS